MKEPEIYIRHKETVQVMWFGGSMINCLEVFRWVETFAKHAVDGVEGEPALRGVQLDAESGSMTLETSAGDVPVKLGDYVVKDERGKFVRYSESIFKAMFESQKSFEMAKKTPVCPYCLSDSRHTPLADPDSHNGCTVCGRAYSGPSREKEFALLEQAGLVEKAVPNRRV